MAASLGDFIPEAYRADLAKELEQQLRVLKWYASNDEFKRKSHTEIEPLDPEYLAARAAWQERWKAVCDEGIEQGWLYYDTYEGIGLTREGESVVERVRKTVYDETVEEWRERLREAGKETVTFQVKKRDKQ